MNAEQRFCPVCNQAFVDAEAVLRCGGCSVMHHPACWVRNRGCATDGIHDQSAEPVAYARSRTPPVLPHPAEGTRVRRADAGAGPVIGAAPEEDAGGGADEDEYADEEYPDDGDYGGDAGAPPDEHVDRGLDADEPMAPAPRRRPPVEPPRAVRAGRYAPMDVVPVRRPMPAVYRSHRVLRFWYVPLAILLGAGVAAGVVYLADALLGDETTPAGGAVTPTAVPTLPPATASPQPSVTPGASVSPAATARATPSVVDPTPSGPGVFAIGQQVVVRGTGDCLRVREAPTTQATQLSCFPDGTEAVILSGPAEADGFRWWKVRAEGIQEGWAVEEYMAPKP